MANNENGPGDVLVFVETQNNEVAGVSLELICKAGELADRIGSRVCAVAAGDNIRPLCKDIFAYGCHTVYLVEDPRLKHYETLPFAKILVQAVKNIKPRVALFGATAIGRDLAPRIASELRIGLTADCTELKIGDHEDKKNSITYKDLLYQIRPAFGGNIIATIITPEHTPQVATVREGVMKLGSPTTHTDGSIVPLDITLGNGDFANEIVERVVGSKKVNLQACDIIVAGGGGLGSRANAKLLEELAETLGGTVGGSRAAVDNGLIDHDRQIGQTGTTVRPKLYIACGISGSIQHRAGMDQSAKIVAVNNDPTAPIFDIAHYKIVGKLEEVIPFLIKSYKTKN